MPLVRALQSGYQIGRSAGGGGIGLALKGIADKLRAQRQTQESLGLLGQAERVKAQVKAEYDPEAKYKKELYGMILGKSDVGMPSAIGKTSDIGGYKPESFELGGIIFKRGETEAERQQAVQQKAEEQATVASEKERQLNISKIKRLGTMADVIERQWKATEPGKGGKGRVAGLMSIPASMLQLNEQQQIDSAYRTFVKGMRAQLARAMGDVGNLSEPEQAAAMALVPGLGDNLETGTLKIKTIREFVKAIEMGNIDNARGILDKAQGEGLTQSDEQGALKTKSGISFTYEKVGD